ncbi:putative peptidoglycan binding protein [Hephaestia caeni]|uniref:Putative peptidoglycan binding protein n=1 Tax=Hephaestia caeni TaxID=645617 RepID=A0A397NIV6_9SPHN|nr:glycosyl hydrolase 108 family protein [Hephaestia caeni]RIA37462.1 putative peptidoglycan binding protein [Hephaestia caeni]
MASNKQKAGAAGAISVAALAIIAALFNVEGGYVDHPSDPGGATKHGITEKVARMHGYEGAMRALPKGFAQAVYYQDYIAGPGFDRLIGVSEPVAREAIDSGVNTGPAHPSRWLQTALNSLNRRQRDYADIAIDGRVGPATVRAYQSLARLRGDATACRLVVRLMDAQQGAYYLSLAHGNSRFEDFMVGWAANRIGNVDLGRC